MKELIMNDMLNITDYAITEKRLDMQIDLWNSIFGYETPDKDSEYGSLGKSIVEYLEYCAKNRVSVNLEGIQNISWIYEDKSRANNSRKRKISKPQAVKVFQILNLTSLDTGLNTVVSLTEASEMIYRCNLTLRIMDAARVTLKGEDHFFSDIEHEELLERIDVLTEMTNNYVNQISKSALAGIGMKRAS